MEELGTLWAYESESIEELKQRLLHATLELESANKLKTELFDLLKTVYEERDKLREALTKILQNKLATTSSINNNNNNVPNDTNTINPQSLMMIMVPNTKTNSSITESNSLSHGSSAVDSFLDAVSSPDFSNINVVDSRNVGLQRDPANVVIENLTKGKTLPQKGKLLQSVMEAGPLLQNLLVAGPLPSWRNPPPVKPIKLPPFNLKDFESSALWSNSSGFSMKALESCSSSASSMLNFAINNPVSWQSSSSPSFSYQVPLSKRQRI